VRLLLDTHTMYWYIEGDPQLSGTARTLIQAASNEVLISPNPVPVKLHSFLAEFPHRQRSKAACEFGSQVSRV